MADELHVATLNLRNIADRWTERLPLLLADMAALQPDLIGLQECVFAAQQDRVLGAAGEGRYAPGAAGPAGPSTATRSSGASRSRSVTATASSSAAVARRSACPSRSPSGTTLDFVVTHLHHEVEDAAVRTEQAASLIGVARRDRRARSSSSATSTPSRRSRRTGLMLDAGFRSASVEANGAEPAVTWPSGIQAPGMDVDGDPGCLDYIWLRGPITVDSCRLAFDRPAVDDPTLFPSDHFGLSARVRIGG